MPVDKVDIIISEWMGYFLLYESMLDTVLFARDKWLSKEGILLPDRAVIYLAGVDDEQYRDRKLNFWNNVYDVDMSTIKPWVQLEPNVDILNKQQLVTHPAPILDIHLKTCQKQDLDFTAHFQLHLNSNQTQISALVAWFDCYFSFSHKPNILSTSI